MCIILDANLFTDFMNKTPDMQPIWRWLEGVRGSQRRGKLAYSPTDKFKAEVGKHPRFETNLVELYRAGLLKVVPAAEVKEAEDTLPPLKSDDAHIVALAVAGKVSVLVSRDKNLHADFKNLARGKVYQTAKHKRLLKPDLCD